MKNRIFIIAALAFLFVSFNSGCVRTVDNRNRFGNPVQADRVEARYERAADQVFEAARETLSFNGSFIAGNPFTEVKTLEGTVDDRSVYIRIQEEENGLTYMVVQARTKRGAGDVAMASEIDKQIALRLARK
jgi:RNA binding exosome subunit